MNHITNGAAAYSTASPLTLKSPITTATRLPRFDDVVLVREHHPIGPCRSRARRSGAIVPPLSMVGTTRDTRVLFIVKLRHGFLGIQEPSPWRESTTR